jgi:2-polyprenyl-3-methyl-5-hydroxy-6-metoxy-1,4-benzoquinol methylase
MRIDFMEELTAEDYEYRFPDHWIDHELKSGSLFEKLHRAYAARAIEIIKESGAKTVLEVGCGDGWICGQMVKADLDVVGVDWSKNAILYASTFVPKAKFFCGDVRDPEFLCRFPNKFDALALIEVLEHIPPKDCISAMMNIATPLKPGGAFVLTTPSVNLPNTSTLHYQHFTEDMLRHTAKEAGLIVKSIEGYGDMRANDAYWRKMRWVENRYYAIKPAARYMTEKYHRETNLRNTPLDRCHGFIMTMTKL